MCCGSVAGLLLREYGVMGNGSGKEVSLINFGRFVQLPGGLPLDNYC